MLIRRSLLAKVIEQTVKEVAEQRKKLVVLRGLPGQGKSTFIKNFIDKEQPQDYKVCSADNFFMKLGGGSYRFDPKMLPKAHEECKKDAEQAMQNGTELIFIDNTNIKKWEFKHYLDLARKYGYEAEEKVIGGFSDQDVEVSANRNVHGVPRDAIERMAKSFEK